MYVYIYIHISTLSVQNETCAMLLSIAHVLFCTDNVDI